MNIEYEHYRTMLGEAKYDSDIKRGILNKSALYTIMKKCSYQLKLYYFDRIRFPPNRAMKEGIDFHQYHEMFWGWANKHAINFADLNHRDMVNFMASTIDRRNYPAMREMCENFIQFEAVRLTSLMNKYSVAEALTYWKPILVEKRCTNWDLRISTKVDRMHIHENKEVSILEIKTGQGFNQTDIRRELCFGKLVMEGCEPAWRSQWPITMGIMYNPRLDSVNREHSRFKERLKKASVNALMKQIPKCLAVIDEGEYPIKPTDWNCGVCQYFPCDQLKGGGRKE